MTSFILVSCLIFVCGTFYLSETRQQHHQTITVRISTCLTVGHNFSPHIWLSRSWDTVEIWKKLWHHLHHYPPHSVCLFPTYWHRHDSISCFKLLNDNKADIFRIRLVYGSHCNIQLTIWIDPLTFNILYFVILCLFVYMASAGPSIAPSSGECKRKSTLF